MEVGWAGFVKGQVVVEVGASCESEGGCKGSHKLGIMFMSPGPMVV